MRVLVIGEKEKAEIQRVRQYAEAHPILREQMRQLEKSQTHIGDDPNFRCLLPVGFRVVFSVEEQPPGLCRHISVSVNTPGRWPTPEAVEMIMREFGFRGGIKDVLSVYKEEAAGAINVIELADRSELEHGARN